MIFAIMLLCLLCFISLVWLSRAFQLLISLKAMPQIHPAPWDKAAPPLVSVIVPMKNEIKNASECLAGLKAQNYPAFEIIAANDNSTDGTRQVLENAGVHCVQVPPTPEGWTGKNFAIHTAVAHARGEWLLFTDADTRHEKSSLSSALRYAAGKNLSLLTLLPRCLAEGFFENLIQPAAMAFTGLWFPIQKINDPDSPVYFANGQYLLIRRNFYEKCGGHQAIKGEFLEDFALMKKAKEARLSAECALGADLYGTRMYDSLGNIWKGWRRIYLHAFQSRPRELFLRAFSTGFFSITPLVILIYTTAAVQNSGLIAAACLLQFFVLIICWRGYQIVKARPAFAILHPLAAFLISLLLIDAAWIAATKQKTVWR